MSERILRLCKRLGKFSFEDIYTVAEDIEQSILESELKILVENNILKNNNGIYLYCKKAHNIVNKYNTFKYYTKASINLSIKCFCAHISTIKAINITEVSHKSIENFYNLFRQIIYERQYEDLKKLYSASNQKYRERTFFGNIKTYFYIYNNQVYVSKNPLVSDSDKLPSKEERLEFKKIYCYLVRQMESHNKNKTNLEYKIAESIWRRNRDYDYLYNDLKNNLLNINS